MKRPQTLTALVAALLMLAGCANHKPTEELDEFTYIVGGDTLKEIFANCDKLKLYTLDDDLAGNQLLEELVDLYNARRIQEAVYEDAETYILFVEEGSVEEDNEEEVSEEEGYVEEDNEEGEGDNDSWQEGLTAIANVDCSILKDDETRQWVEDYKQSVLHLLEGDHEAGEDEDEYAVARYLYEAVDSLAYDLYFRLGNRYSLYRYGNITQEEFEDAIDKSYEKAGYTPYLEKRYEKLDSAEIVKHGAELRERYEGAESFDAKCLYGTEIAHHASKYSRLDEEEEKALSLMEGLLTAGEYSVHLQTVFQDWQCLAQYGYGLSRYSFIPNPYYNAIRRHAFDTIIRYLAQHPDDMMVVNSAMMFAQINGVYRNGGYGNTAMVAHYRRYPESYD